ncbi:MAG TPA: TIR domain-containing protein [Gammaproteobacteria bacterium]
MSDIFLSYASEDVTRAAILAHALEHQGWSVWWDRSILPGKVFDTVIEAELSAARCVIVLWSAPSVASRWVRAEAGEALDKGRLIPVLLDEVVIPLVFRQVQAASLIGWDGDEAHAGFQHLLKAISAVLPSQPVAGGHAAAGAVAAGIAGDNDNRSRSGAHGTGRDARGGTHRRTLGLWSVLAVCAVLVAGGAFFYLRDDTSGVTPIAVKQRPELPPGTIAATPAPQPRQTTQDDAAKPVESRPVEAKPVEVPVEPAEPEPRTALTESAKSPESSQQSAPQPASSTAGQIKNEPAKLPDPVVERSAPVIVKPERVTERPVARPEPLPEPLRKPSPETVAKAEPAQAAAKPVQPLTILTVTWATPSDDGVDTAAHVKEYSTALSRMMAAIADEAISGPLRFEYHYPDQQEYYRLLKDNNGNAASKALCNQRRADLVISGFVKGAKFVSSSYGYALTREPVFSVFDCATNTKTTQTYEVAEHVDDDFPFEKSTTAVFRRFVQQDSALARR